MGSKIHKLVDELLSKKWMELYNEKSSIENLEYPGVYLLAYSDRKLKDKNINLRDIFYVGMTNSAGGVKQRLNQFINGIEKNRQHSGGMRFLKEYMNGTPYSESKMTRKFFVASISFECEVRKEKRRETDLQIMGDIACLEYYVLAHIKKAVGSEPELNKK